MKRSIKFMCLGAVLLGAVSAVTSCGNKDEFNGLTINFWHTFGHTVADGLQGYANKFSVLIKQQEGKDVRIKLTYKGGYDDVKGEVTKNLATGGNPTITVAYPDHVADYFAAESTPGEYVVNLQKFVDDPEIGFGTEAFLGDTAGADDFVEKFYEESTSYSRPGVYSIPFLKSTEALLYNFDLVKKAMPYFDPTVVEDDDIKERMSELTWDEFMEFCQVINENKVNISTKIQVPCAYDSDGNFFITQMFQKNIPYAGISPDGKGYIGFNGKATNPTESQTKAYGDVQNMLKQCYDWYKNGYFTTKGVYGQYSSYLFTPGEAVFAIGSTGGSGYSFPATSEFRVEACKVPAFNSENAVYVTQGPTLTIMNNARMISAGTNDEAVKYAWKFVKYITNPEVNASMCTTNSEGYMPVRQSAYNTKIFTDFMASDTEYVKVAKVVVNDIAGDYFNAKVFKGSATLREQVGACLADCLKISTSISDAEVRNKIKGFLDDAIDNTTLKM